MAFFTRIFPERSGDRKIKFASRLCARGKQQRHPSLFVADWNCRSELPAGRNACVFRPLPRMQGRRQHTQTQHQGLVRQAGHPDMRVRPRPAVIYFTGDLGRVPSCHERQIGAMPILSSNLDRIEQWTLSEQKQSCSDQQQETEMGNFDQWTQSVPEAGGGERSWGGHGGRL